jgi:tetratricopeptide (TPR) repeat protein
MEKAMKYTWIMSGALLLSGLAGQVSADTDWCYKYLQQKEYDKSIEACTRELKSGKYDSEKEIIASRLLYRGEAYLNKNDRRNYDKAIADLTRSIALVPDDVETLTERAMVCVWSGRYGRAIDDYSRILSMVHQLSSRPRFYQGRGVAYWLNGENDRAIADFTEAIAYCEGLDQNSRRTMYNDLHYLYEFRGNVYYSTGDYEKAVDDYAKAIAFDSYGSNLQLRSWLALEKLSVRRADEYRDVLRTSAKKGSGAEVVKLYLGDGVTENDVLAEARREDDEMSRRGNLCKAYYYLGEWRLLRGDWKGAEAFFAKSAAIEYRYRTSEQMLARVLLPQVRKPHPPERKHNMGRMRWLPR